MFELYQDYLISHSVDAKQIISVNLEAGEFEDITDDKALYEYVSARLDGGRMNYIFLDEVQRVEEFQKAVDALYIKKNCDVYITGSNAYLLSGELATLLSGRYVEIKMLPLSFKEYAAARGANIAPERLYQDYIHNSSSANVLLGLRAAEFCKAVLYGGQTCFAPDLQSAVMEKDVVTLTFSHCGEGLVVTESALAAKAFVVEDERGENISILALFDGDASAGRLHLYLAKCPAGHGVISFASGCNPAASCIFDHKTRIPPLSFFRNVIISPL